MPKQTKVKTVNLYNIDLQEKNKKSKPKSKTSSKKKSKKTEQSDKFNFDNEIIIGVKPIKETKKKNNKEITKKKQEASNNKSKLQLNTTKKKQITKKNKTNKIQNAKKLNTVTNHKKNIKEAKQLENKKSKTSLQIVKWTVLIACLIGSIIFVMMSPIFNIAEIQVTGYNKISDEQIISLSKLNIGQNIFQINKTHLTENIKKSSYIENAKITRKLPNILQIQVEERTPTYMLEYANSFVYINNQGYILEVNNNAKSIPIITGQKTMQEEIFEGNRLCIEDLEKLETVIKIVDTAANNDIAYLITKIDISDKQNYTLILEDEQKTVYLGDATDISTKILYLKKILNLTSGKKGELFMNGDLNTKDVYFREEITE